MNGSAVQPRLEFQLAVIGNFVRGDHIRTKRARARKVFARRELDRMTLPVADTHIIVTGVASHIVQSIITRNVAAVPPDHNGQLALIIELF